MNKIILIGRLTKDAELRILEEGKSVFNFTLAVDRDYLDSNNERGVDFIPVTYWVKHATKLQNYLLKGRLIGASGRIQVRSYVAQDGNKRYVTEVVADEIKLLDSKRASNSDAEIAVF